MTNPWKRKEVIGDCTLYLGDCMEVMPTLGKVDAVEKRIKHEKSAEGKGKGWEIERALHRRDTINFLSKDDIEGQMQQMRGYGYAGDTSQGSQPYEQCHRESRSALQPLPHKSPQNRMVAIPEGWAILTDPPYGIGIDGQAKRVKGKKSDRKGFEFKGWDKERPSDALEYISAIDCAQIIWGGNYFADILKKGDKWLVWDKGQRIKQSDCELAYSNMKGALRVYTLNRVALQKDGTQHPTQKPVELMEWCIGHLPKDTETILDPFMGSGTTLVACAKLGRSGIGIELDEDYFNIACERVEKAYQQTDLFVAPPENKDIKRNQINMFDDGDAA